MPLCELLQDAERGRGLARTVFCYPLKSKHDTAQIVDNLRVRTPGVVDVCCKPAHSMYDGQDTMRNLNKNVEAISEIVN